MGAIFREDQAGTWASVQLTETTLKANRYLSCHQLKGLKAQFRVELEELGGIGMFSTLIQLTT